MNPGIYDVTAEQYHADPCDQPSLTASIGKIFTTESPLHAWTRHPKLNPSFERLDEDKFDIGTATHALLLQGEQIVRVIDANDWRTKAAQTARVEARERRLVPLLAREWEKVQAMVAAVRDQLAARDDQPPLLGGGKPERMLVWDEDGVTCRALVDWLHDDYTAIDDLKTTKASANPYQWARRTLWSIGADVQVAFNLRGLKKITGRDAEFRYIVAETSPPYALSVISLAPSALALANDKVERIIERWKVCLATDVWPGYPTDICYAEAPPWVEMEYMEHDAGVLLP